MLPGLTPYHIDIQQGNVVTQEMVDRLKPGMTRQQVRFVMGSPPLVDPFHKDRWDYVYYLNKAGRVVEQRRLILLFDGDVLKRVEGDVVVGSRASAEGKPAGSALVKPPEAAAGTQARPQSDKPQTANPQIEGSLTDKPQIAKPQPEGSLTDKPQTAKPQASESPMDKSQTDKAQTTASPTGKPEVDKPPADAPPAQ